MDGIHDMGGMHGFGPVVRETDEAVFHGAWEGRAFGLLLQAADSIGFVDDHLRSRIERIPAADYLRSSYYQLWMRALETLMVERGVATTTEIATRVTATEEAGRAPGGSPITLDEIDAMIAAGASTKRPEVKAAPGFAVGEHVRVRNDHPFHHTRATRYARGRTGEVVKAHGVFVFPDSNSEQQGEAPQHCYCVRFAARELWGESASPRDSVCLDLWESYLEPA
jgi:nitrile hydratase subunit beta